MKISNQRKPGKYLFLFGPFFLTAGLTVGLISGKFDTLAVVLLILGIVIIVSWLVWQSKQSRWWEQRSTQAGTNAVVATIAVIAILAIINFLGVRYHVRSDLTETKLFSLAPQSRQLVRSLQQNIKVWVFDVNKNPLDLNLLENYQRQNPKFQFEYVDLQAKPLLVREFGVKQQGEVYLEANNQRQLVQVVNERDRLSEISLTNRLQQITNANPTKVYFLQGHGEYQISGNENSISQAIQALNDKSFTSEPLSLADQKIPSDTKVLVIAGVKRPLLTPEVQAIQDYLNGGGNILLMIDPNTDPKLEPLLNQWGVKLDNRLAVDITENEAPDPRIIIINEYGNHPITKDFGNGSSVYRLARPIDTVPTPGITATPLLTTKPYPNTWAESDQKSEKLEYNAGKDRQGPLTLGVALVRKAETPIPQAVPTPTVGSSPPTTPTPTNTPKPTPTATPTPTPTPISKTTAESRLVVIGNSDFAANGPFALQLNGDVFLNSVTWLSQQDQQPLSIRPKEAKNRRINLSGAQGALLGWTSLLLLPLIGFIASALIWWQRR